MSVDGTKRRSHITSVRLRSWPRSSYRWRFETDTPHRATKIDIRELPSQRELVNVTLKWRSAVRKSQKRDVRFGQCNIYNTERRILSV